MSWAGVRLRELGAHLVRSDARVLGDLLRQVGPLELVEVLEVPEVGGVERAVRAAHLRAPRVLSVRA